MEMHIGVDDKFELCHSIEPTAANQLLTVKSNASSVLPVAWVFKERRVQARNDVS